MVGMDLDTTYVTGEISKLTVTRLREGDEWRAYTTMH